MNNEPRWLMGNRKAREFMIMQEHEAAWNRATFEPRSIYSDVHAHGIGLRKLQLIVFPSFEPAWAWDVRHRQGDWWLFRSQIVEGQLLGYDPIEIDPTILASFVARVTSLTLPIAPYRDDVGGADGTTTRLAIFGGLSSETRFQWWSEFPEHWRPLVEIANEMLNVFSKLKASERT